MKSNILSKVLVFAAGAAVGSLVTVKVVQARYEQLIQEEIESVKEAYAKLSKKAAAEEEEEDPDEDQYYDIINKEGYTASEEEEDDMELPYVISPDDFGECDYVQVSLTYCADGVVVNDRGKEVVNVDELVGLESLTHFGEYEDDSVFVRNDKLQIDFEILKDYRKSSEIN